MSQYGVEELLKAVDKHRTWRCAMNCVGYINRHDLEPRTMDICQFIDKDTIRYLTIQSKSAFMFDPKQFHGNSPDMILSMESYLKNESRRNGFELVRDHKKSKTTPRGKVLCSLQFNCKHNQPVVTKQSWTNDTEDMHHPQTKKEPQKQTKTRKVVNDSKPTRRRLFTHKPSAEDLRCPFSVKVFCDVKDSNWYLAYNTQNGDDNVSTNHVYDPSLHRGHFKLDADSIEIPRKDLEKHCEERINLLSTVGINSQFTANIVNLELNGCLEGYVNRQNICQMQHSRNIDQLLSNATKDMSSAEKIINYFDNMISKGEEIEYCALIHSGQHGFQVKNPKGRPKSGYGIERGK